MRPETSVVYHAGMKASVKIVGASGQISLGKEFAGRQVLVEEPQPGVWLVRTATVVPDNEQWLHTPEAREALLESLAWAEVTPAHATDLSNLRESLSDGRQAGKKQSRSTRTTRPKQSRVPA